MIGEATVNLLTAEVKTLMIGSRQVTLSIWNQLDHVYPDEILPFGRVADVPGKGRRVASLVAPAVWVAGKHKGSGMLVASFLPLGVFATEVYVRNNSSRYFRREQELTELAASWQALDLIVLAGLR